MSWISRVWDGPFKTPQQQPITVGWVLLKLFETLWRLLLIVVLLIAAVGVYIWYDAENPLSSQIGVGLSPAPSDCIAKGWPILATIENKSSKTIGELGLKFRVYPQGTSTDVVSYDYLQPDLHEIVRPGDVLNWCFSMPRLDAESTGPYTVAADVNYAFELSKDIPVTSRPQPKPQLTPPPLVQINAPPPIETVTTPVHPPAPPRTWWTKIVDGVVAVASLALFAMGGFGFMLLLSSLGERLNIARSLRVGEKLGTGLFILCFAANAMMVWAASVVLSSLGLGAWEMQLDTWSWAHGFQDGGTLLVAAIASEWPWVAWIGIHRSRRADA